MSAEEITKLFVTLGLNATGYTEGVDRVGKKNELMSANIKRTAAIMTGAGVAVEALARAQAPLTEQTRRLAASTGMTEGEMRKLATSTSNVTFPLEDVLNLMETGRQRGIEGAEALQQYATFWDTVGDATGETSTALAEAGVALRGVGIAAGQEAEALSAFGFVTENTTQSVGDFLQFLQLSGPELRDMGMTINDTAAVLGILEEEFGMTGRTARSEFDEAVREAEGSMDNLLSILGITQEQFHSYNQAVEDSSGIIQRNADIHAKGYTMVQKFQHWVSEATYSMGGFIESAANIAPLFSGASGMIVLLEHASKAKGALSLASVGATAKMHLKTAATKIYTGVTIGATAATRGLATAMAFITGPIGLAMTAITALIGVGYLLIKNFNDIESTATEVLHWVGNRFNSFKNTVSSAIYWVISRINELIYWINKIPVVNLPTIGGKGGGIPALATGGEIASPGTVLVGELGPELLTLPQGAKVTPLPAGGAQEVRHSGSIDIRGINDRGQLVSVIEAVLPDILYREARQA